MYLQFFLMEFKFSAFSTSSNGIFHYPKFVQSSVRFEEYLFFVFVSLENVRPFSIELYLSIFTSRLVLRGKTWRHASHKACSRILHCKSGTFDLSSRGEKNFDHWERKRGKILVHLFPFKTTKLPFPFLRSRFFLSRLIQIFKKDLDRSVF